MQHDKGKMYVTSDTSKDSNADAHMVGKQKQDSGQKAGSKTECGQKTLKVKNTSNAEQSDTDTKTHRHKVTQRRENNQNAHYTGGKTGRHSCSLLVPDVQSHRGRPCEQEVGRKWNDKR